MGAWTRRVQPKGGWIVLRTKLGMLQDGHSDRTGPDIMCGRRPWRMLIPVAEAMARAHRTKHVVGADPEREKPNTFLLLKRANWISFQEFRMRRRD